MIKGLVRRVRLKGMRMQYEALGLPVPPEHELETILDGERKLGDEEFISIPESLRRWWRSR